MINRTILISLILLVSLPLSASTERKVLQRGKLELQSVTDSTVDAPILSTLVDFKIAGLTARVKVTQQFKNDSADWVEGKYLFPLPEKSAVDSLKMKIGERIIIGEIKEKEAAKKIYQQAKISGKKASLIEQHRPNVFMNSVANIAPFETIEVIIEYQQDLSFEKDGSLSIRFPMTMTQRYTPSAQVKETFMNFKQGFQYYPSAFENIDLPQNNANQPGNDVAIHVALAVGMPVESITSSSHAIVKQQSSDNQYQITLAGDTNKADRDFILRWKPLPGAEPRAALFSETVEEDTYLSLMLMPPKLEGKEQIVSRQMIFVIDTSGSMGGESIRQAKSALRYALTTLNSGDSFNVIEFDDQTRALFFAPQAVTQSSLMQAENFIDGLNADGGTEMLPALKRALADVNQDKDSGQVQQIIFLTDGAISNEASLFQMIRNELGDARLFTVGIGSAPNEFFMRRAANFGRGNATFIADVSNSEEKMRELFAQISQPLLTHVDIQWPRGSEVEMWPQKIPDLFAGEPLWIKAKVKTSQLGATVEVNGQLANSQWQTRLQLGKGEAQSGIARLWAREKIAAIMDQGNHAQLAPKARQQIIDTALKFQLVSRFTSLVAVDKTPSRVGERLLKKSIPQALPQGSANQTLNYPKTALSYPLSPRLALNIFLLAMSFLLVTRIISARRFE